MTLDVRFRLIPNLTYHLDVAADLLGMTGSENIRQLWTKRFLVTDEDRRMIERWRMSRQSVAPSGGQRRSKVRFPIEILGYTDDSETSIRGVGFDAADSTDYRARLAKVVAPAVADDLASVVDYFQPRFREWWSEVALPKGTPFADGIDKWIASPPLQRSLSSIVQFYRPQLPAGYALPMVLLYRPNDVKEPSNGQQLGKYAVAQFLPDELPSNRIDVVLHELCHFFFRSASDADLAAMQQRFLDLRDPAAVPAYNLLNEVMATALGNGVVGEQVSSAERWQKVLETPRSMYNDEDIDAGAKAVFPWIKTYLAEGGTLFDPGFPRRFTDSLKGALGERLVRPRVYFIRLLALYDDSLGAMEPGLLPRRLRCASYSRSTTDLSKAEPTEEFSPGPADSTLLIVSPKRLPRLVERGYISDDQLAEISAKKVEPFVLFGHRRGRDAISMVLVANDPAGVDAGVAKIAAMDRFVEGVVP